MTIFQVQLSQKQFQHLMLITVFPSANFAGLGLLQSTLLIFADIPVTEIMLLDFKENKHHQELNSINFDFSKHSYSPSCSLTVFSLLGY